MTHLVRDLVLESIYLRLEFSLTLNCAHQKLGVLFIFTQVIDLWAGVLGIKDEIFVTI